MNSKLQNIMASLFQSYEKEFWQPDTLLLGNIPEFDSMAIVTLLTMLEEQLGIVIEDDEIDADTFESFGSLNQYIEEKLA